MCGIALCYSNKLNHQNTVQQIIKKIRHRGPDDEGEYFNKNFSLGSCIVFLTFQKKVVCR